ncbi:MAG: bifunctional 5,10-methylenetetrahydrofolate dehydrogenase/5,10-methenyltetrahydrofolate cyclohydrolase [Phycisphaerae bacterium]|nr:bifunctional 5,10-methylenetetrahydrofolate dehydrogenase/5,10-methenyltetrahydrofolate cyclohydrolase [Phycisphaerae bacterium]
MPARILDGRAAAADQRNSISAAVAHHTTHHGPIRLCSLLVGSDEAGLLYAKSQHHRCLQVGIQHELLQFDNSIGERQLLAEIDRLNANPLTTGIMLHMPLPEHIDAARAQYRIDPYKDVEGVSPANIGWLFYGEPIIAPCTALAAIELIKRSGLELRGAEAVVVGQSRIVGRPLSLYLNMQMATVTSCHIATRDLAAHTRNADLLIVAVGKPHLIGPDHVKPGAVVIDVGINKITIKDDAGNESRKTVGDVDFDAVAPIAGAITPVPGGVGPLTVMMLMRNVAEAARKQLDRKL